MKHCLAFRSFLKPQRGAAVAALVLWVGLPSISPVGDAATLNKHDLERSLAASPLNEEQRIVHVLNRLGYGPRPGDVERVKAMGLAEYIALQLNPESIDDSAVERRLDRLETLDKSSRELAEYLPDPRAQRRPEQNRRPDAGTPEPEESMRRAQQGIRRVSLELQQAKILRATYSERQLQEAMTDFWFNHFNIFMGKGADRILTTGYERESIRPHTLGNFRDLLEATAKSPAMLFYLDNWMSVDPNARYPQARTAGRPRSRENSPPEAAANRRNRGLNENYARELLELHTLGVDGGYTQRDVTEVARCFTGWTIRNPRQGGDFQFVRILHDSGEKTVLGTRIAAGGGIEDGERVLDILARHPSTARFLSVKLCRRFVSDNPSESLVRRCADTFQKTEGDIRQVLAVVFTSPEFYSKESYRSKVKKPFDLVVSSLRSVDAQTVVPPRILFSLRSMGETLYGCQPPTGYPETADAWINTGALLERINFATELAAGRVPGTRVRLEDPKLDRSKTVQAVEAVALELLHEKPRKEFVRSIVDKLEDARTGLAASENSIATIAGLILGSPEFQKR